MDKLEPRFLALINNIRHIQKTYYYYNSNKDKDKTYDVENLVKPGTIDALITVIAESVSNGSMHKTFPYLDRQKIIFAVMERFPSGRFSRAKIEKAVQDVLNAT